MWLVFKRTNPLGLQALLRKRFLNRFGVLNLMHLSALLLQSLLLSSQDTHLAFWPGNPLLPRGYCPRRRSPTTLSWGRRRQGHKECSPASMPAALPQSEPLPATHPPHWLHEQPQPAGATDPLQPHWWVLQENSAQAKDSITLDATHFQMCLLALSNPMANWSSFVYFKA